MYDDCPQICEEYASYDNHICVVHRENGGLSVARNNGIEIANKTFISANTYTIYHYQSS